MRAFVRGGHQAQVVFFEEFAAVATRFSGAGCNSFPGVFILLLTRRPHQEQTIPSSPLKTLDFADLERFLLPITSRSSI